MATIRLNIEYNPESHYSYFILGQLLFARQDREGAISAIGENNWYKGALKRAQNQ